MALEVFSWFIRFAMWCPWTVVSTVFPLTALQLYFTSFKRTANGKPVVFSQLPTLMRSFSMQEHPPHLPTGWRTGPRDGKMQRRRSEKKAPHHVNWVRLVCGRQKLKDPCDELSAYSLLGRQIGVGQIKLQRRTSSFHGSRFCSDLKGSHHGKSHQLLCHPEYYQLTD